MSTATGVALRDAGQEAVLAADTAAHRGFAEWIDKAIDQLASQESEPWSVDDVRALASRLAQEDGVDFRPAPNLLPSRMGTFAGVGLIVRQPRDVNSQRPSRHSSRVGLYLGPNHSPTPPTTY